MAVTYEQIQRQVILRANQLQADSAATLSTLYATATIGQTEMGDRATEYPALAINDAILNAGDAMVNAIGNNRHSPYRVFFADVTGSLANGATVPLVSTTPKPRVGIIGDIRDAGTNQKLTAASFQVIQGYNNLKTNILKVNPYLYYTDNVRVWHTTTNVIADCVVWSKTDQQTLMQATPTRGACPFSEDLIECLICGALGYVFRGTFNVEQVDKWRAYFVDSLTRLRGDSVGETQQRTIDD